MHNLLETSNEHHLMSIVCSWWERSGFKVDAYGIITDEAGAPITLERARRRFKMATTAIRDPRRGITLEALIDAFDEYYDQMQDNGKRAVLESVKYSPNAPKDAILNFLIALKGVGYPEEIFVLEHFLWQIKRKLAGLPVKHHLMPIITGPQGTGKSTLIAKLLEPVAPVVITGRPVDFVTDERNFKTLNENFVIFFDEMAKASRTDADRLKEIISAHVLSYRMLHTNNSTKTLQNCTFIGAANKDIRELIYDTTGMRRFYQIIIDPKITEEEKRERWAIVKDLDILSIWRAVDENSEREKEIEFFMPILQAAQEEFRARTSVEEFVEECGLVVDESARIGAQQLYNKYKEFCDEAGRRDPLMKRSFIRELVGMGFERVRGSEGIKLNARLSKGTEMNKLKVL